MPTMKSGGSVYDESVVYPFVKTLSVPSLRPAALRCIGSVFYNFFFRQYRAALLPGSVPVSRVDHPLDEKIPFVPSWITIYLDFIAFWVRVLGFLLHRHGRKSFTVVKDFMEAMGRLYAFAAETYRKNFSTTRRPFYIARPRFLLIHLVDPHLMCIPSLHVMVVILTYTRFAAALRSLGDADNCAPHLEEMKQGALAITRAILFVKQHSVNCVSAALYAMTCFDGALFPPEEAEAFAALLFGPSPPVVTATVLPRHGRFPANYRARPCASPRTRLPESDAAEITAHIISLYRKFLTERNITMDSGKSQNWEEPLLQFMRGLR